MANGNTCPACGGRGAIANAQTGNPATCPLCQGTTKVSLGLTDQLFWYVLNPAQLTANQLGVISTVTIDNDADFEWRWIIGSSTGLFSVELKDLFAGGAPLMPSPINGENFQGTAQLPFVLPKPYPLYRTSSIQGKFNDRSGAPNTIQTCLVGYKLDKLPKAPTQS
jgi:hypothetical protein